MTKQMYARTIVEFHEELALWVGKYIAIDEALDDLAYQHQANVAPVAPNLIEDIAMLENFYQAKLKYKGNKKALDEEHESLLKELKAVEGEIVRLLAGMELSNTWLKVMLDSMDYGVRYCFSNWSSTHFLVEVQHWITPMPEPYRDPVD